MRGNEKGMLPGLAILEFPKETAAATYHKTQSNCLSYIDLNLKLRPNVGQKQARNNTMQ